MIVASVLLSKYTQEQLKVIETVSNNWNEIKTSIHERARSPAKGLQSLTKMLQIIFSIRLACVICAT